jgi:hypothetical protein
MKLFWRLILAIFLRMAFSSDWCPTDCSMSDYKPLCGTNSLFIISTGRTGSTTILHALNLVPGIHMIGETGLISSIRVLYQDSAGSLDRIRNITILQELQHLYWLLNCPSQSHQDQRNAILGGKEVHVSPRDIFFLKELFPCSRFIFSLRRNSQTQSRSAFHKNRGFSASSLSTKNAYLRRLHDTWAPDTFLMDLEDFSPPLFDALLRWLGIHDCSYTSIGQFNMNNTYVHTSPPQLLGSCRFAL